MYTYIYLYGTSTYRNAILKKNIFKGFLKVDTELDDRICYRIE